MNLSDNPPPASPGMSPFAPQLTRLPHVDGGNIPPGVPREQAQPFFQAQRFARATLTGMMATGADLQIY